MALADSLQCGGNRIVSIPYTSTTNCYLIGPCKRRQKQAATDTRLTKTLVRAHSWQKIEHHEMGLFSDVIPFAIGRSLNDVLRHSDVHPLQFGRP